MTGSFVTSVVEQILPVLLQYGTCVDGPPDLYSLKRVIEERILLDGLTCDGSSFVSRH